MDVDLTEEAQSGGADLLTIVGTIQLILDRLAARFVSFNHRWILVGHQHTEADLSFRIIDCPSAERQR